MAISRLWSASPARIVGMPAAGTGGQSASTADAADTVNGPAKTETRRSTARSGSPSSA